MIRLALVMVLSWSSCGGKAVPLRHSEKRPGPLWCFLAVVSAPDGRRMAGCGDTRKLCQRALEMAIRWAAVAGVLEVGDCQQRELR